MTKYYWLRGYFMGAFYENDTKVFEEELEYVDVEGLLSYLRKYYPNNFTEVYDAHKCVEAEDIEPLAKYLESDGDENFPNTFNFNEVLKNDYQENNNLSRQRRRNLL